MLANVDEVTRTCQCIHHILYLFQLYLSHKLHNGQADHPRRTGWYADLFATLKRLQKWRTDLLSSFNLEKISIGLIF